MGIVKGSLQALTVLALVAGSSLSVQSAAPAGGHRSTWDLGQYIWVKLVKQEKGAEPNQHPASLDPVALAAALASIRVTTPDGVEPLFTAPELAGVRGALAEALAVAAPGEDLALLSAHKRGAGLLSSPLAVAARLFVSDGRLQVIVQEARREVLGNYDASQDWPPMDYGHRDKASTKATVTSALATARRSDWLSFALPLAGPGAVAAPAAQAQAQAQAPAPAPAASAPAAPAAPAADPAERLKVLTRLREQNLISEAEYQAKRGEILRGL